jgi:prolyl oligopeptidase
VFDGVSSEFRAWHTTWPSCAPGKPQWRQLFDKDDGVTSLAVAGDRAYALTFKGRFALQAADRQTGRIQPEQREGAAASQRRVLTGLAAASDGLYVEAREGNVKKLLRVEHKDGATPVESQLPVTGAFTLSAPAPGPISRASSSTSRAGHGLARSTRWRLTAR